MQEKCSFFNKRIASFFLILVLVVSLFCVRPQKASAVAVSPAGAFVIGAMTEWFIGTVLDDEFSDVFVNQTFWKNLLKPSDGECNHLWTHNNEGYRYCRFCELSWDVYYDQKYGSYVESLPSTTISSDDLVFFVDYYSSLREKGLCFYANYKNKNGADGACFDYGASTVANRVSAGGSGFLSLAVTPGEKVSISVESEYDLDVAFWFLTSTAYEAVLNSQDLMNSAGSAVAYRIDTGWISPGDIVTVPDGAVCAWLNCRKSDNTEMSLSDLSSFRVNFWDRESSLVDSGDRFGSYMEELDDWNQSNPYLDNPYTPNYYITPDDGDTLYSPAVFSESTKTFTEPHTGNQYLCTRWAYHYSEDNTLTIVGMPVLEGDYLGSYIMDMADNSYYVDGVEIPVLWIIYCTEAMLIMPLYRDADGVITPIGYQWYDYAVVAQTECGIGEHDIEWEVTQDPTCTSTGTQTGTCSICGETQTYQLDQLDHTYQSSVTQQPTCAAAGVMTYTCSSCGTEYTETIAATGVHSYTYETIREPTCGVSGERKYTCSVCGNSYAEDLPPTGDHDWLPSEVDATTYDLPEGTSCPDCSGTNFTHVLNGELYDCTCSDCAAEWAVRAVITYGSTTYTCSLCGASYVEQEGEESGLFTSLANFLTDGITWITDKFVELTESLNGIHTAFQNYMEKIRNVGGDFPAMLGAAIACMPEDFMGVVWFSVIALVVVAVYCKFFK